MSVKPSVVLNEKTFRDLIERGLNKKMIAEELGVTGVLVNQAFERWSLKAKKIHNVIVWEDAVVPVEAPLAVIKETLTTTITKEDDLVVETTLNITTEDTKVVEKHTFTFANEVEEDAFELPEVVQEEEEATEEEINF